MFADKFWIGPRILSYIYDEGSKQIFLLRKPTPAKPELFHLATGSFSALYLYRVLHLAIYPAVLLVPTERPRYPFLIDFW